MSKPSASPDERPNVVLFVGEDHGPHYGCYGDLNARTPYLDQLAATGMRFDGHHTTCAVCSPGRASILTGLHAFQHGQIHLATHRFAMYRPFRNLVETLRGVGYRTGRFGKLHVLPEAAFPFDFVWNDPKKISFTERDVKAAGGAAACFAHQAASDNAPFFAYVCLPDAHLPFLNESHGFPRTPRGGGEIVPPGFCPIPTPRMRDSVAAYYNCLERLDAGVEQVLKALEKSNGRDMIVIVTADHGQQFPRGKLTCHEGGLRVPLLLHAPGRVSEGSVRNDLTSHVDMLPTILQLLGLPSLENRPGIDLLGDPIPAGRAVVGEWTGAGTGFFPQRSIRDQRFKLIVNYCAEDLGDGQRTSGYLPPGFWESSLTEEDLAAAPLEYRQALERDLQPPSEELYNLLDDPFELRNLSQDPAHHEPLARLRQALEEWQGRLSDHIVDPGIRAKLARRFADVAQRHYPRGTSRLPENPEAIHWHYAELLDPGLPA